MENLIGKHFGRLKVVGEAEPHITPNGTAFKQWLCECECGNKIVVNHYSLIRNLTKSCGCLNRELIIERNKLRKKHNKYDLSGEYGIGYTSKGEEFYFDLEDYDLIKNYCWYIRNDGYIAARGINGGTVRLHNLVMGGKLEIDHKNHNKADNRKANLREVTRSQNQMNCGLCSNNTSGVTGVSFEKSSGKWIAKITINRKDINLGRFDKFDDAIVARKLAENKYFGEYSYDNSVK